MGPLTKPFLYENPLGPLGLEIARVAVESGIFAKADLVYLFLTACVNHEDASGSRLSSAVRPNERWKLSRGKQEFHAEFDFDLAGLVAIHRRDTTALLAAALVRLRHLAIQAAAQVGVELEADPKRIAAFIAGFPDVPFSLLPRRLQPRLRSRKRTAIVEVEVLHEGGSASTVLARRADLRERLESVLHEQRLGVFEGGSSGEFHFEFAFRVSDAQRAIALLGATLHAAGVDASRLRFDVDEPED